MEAETHAVSAFGESTALKAGINIGSHLPTYPRGISIASIRSQLQATMPSGRATLRHIFIGQGDTTAPTKYGDQNLHEAVDKREKLG
ncbi:MAG: hypothetical protein GF315_00575 [candidate division Zixibacteria bacterium]|nr:hypothetical protein [candidate division Zixibacteria bacterium]